MKKNACAAWNFSVAQKAFRKFLKMQAGNVSQSTLTLQQIQPSAAASWISIWTNGRLDIFNIYTHHLHALLGVSQEQLDLLSIMKKNRKYLYTQLI